MKIYKFSKLKMIWCYYLRFQVGLTLAIIVWCFLSQKCFLNRVILVILCFVPISFLFVFMHYWRLFLHPKEAELHPDRIVFKWANNEKAYHYEEISLVTIENLDNSTYPVTIVFHFNRDKDLELSVPCLWDAGGFLENLEAKGVKIKSNTRFKIKSKKTGKKF